MGCGAHIEIMDANVLILLDSYLNTDEIVRIFLLFPQARLRKYPKSGSRRGSAVPELGGTAAMVSLSPREKQTLALILIGNQDKEIAAAMGISESTARGKVQQLLHGLALQNRAQLIAWVSQRPNVFEVDWVPLALHPLGCLCSSVYCVMVAKGLGLLSDDPLDDPISLRTHDDTDEIAC
jgi:DNA-binding CsgD family transcriptional regulator